MEGIININGLIGSIELRTGVELVDIVEQVKAQPLATSFKVNINSEGGVVDTGFHIYDYLKSLKVPITTVGNGLVASIATVIFMAGDNRILNEGTRWMIHLPAGEMRGTADQMEAYAKEIRIAEKRLIDFYKETTGISEEGITPLLANETWLSNEQAINLGFATIKPQPVLAVAYFTNNLNTNIKKENMTNDDKSWLEKLFAPILNKGEKVTNITVTDADGKTIDFADLVEGDEPKQGDKATIDGVPAEGEILMPDGATFVFTSGELTEIKVADEPAPEDSEETMALKAEVETLKEQLATATASFTALETSVVNLKKQITSRFDVDSKKEPKKADEQTTNKRQFLK
jgi:ATP-dependent protease ClpP protease subunit